MRFIFQIEDHLVKGEKALVVSFIALMIILSFLQLTLRLLFNSGIVWLDPALRHMVLWTGLTGAVLASRYSRHFAMDAMVKFLPERSRGPLGIASDLIVIAISVLLFGAAGKFIRDEFASGSIAFYIGDLGVPGGWAGMILPLVFLLIAFHTALNIFRPPETRGAEAVRN
ncbi:MAG: TRAP transporter small permease subunit [Elusimicrobiales bacterium]|jgi:TRAP-type C4-dicarboxylate transport system permease small subunit